MRDACVVTMDADRRIHADGAVAIDGERIVAVGATADLARRFGPRRTIAVPALVARARLPALLAAAVAGAEP